MPDDCRIYFYSRLFGLRCVLGNGGNMILVSITILLLLLPSLFRDLPSDKPPEHYTGEFTPGAVEWDEEQTAENQRLTVLGMHK